VVGREGRQKAEQEVSKNVVLSVRLLVPELQRRGLFQKEYAGTTLRENLGLAIPRATDWHAARRKASARHL
jgi:hypothetical protein